MLATLMYNAGEVRVENIPDATIVEPTDAVITISRACICGSDLWPYRLMTPSATGRGMGHEAIGVVAAIGRDVQKLKIGDVVIMPFAYSDGHCDFCDEHLHTSCRHGGFFGIGSPGLGAQAEALRVPQADGTLYPVASTADEALLASLLTLSDVMGTGHHAALCARVAAGKTAAVIGDGAVGLCGVIAARRLGAERIILLGRHPDRIALARDFGATDIIRERGDAAVEQLRALTGGRGAHAVLECVGSEDSAATAMRIVRPGGAIGRVGVPHYETIANAQGSFYDNVTISGGPAPVRAYIETLLPDVLEGRIQPGRVFDRTMSLADISTGYQAMDAREALKVMIKP